MRVIINGIPLLGPRSGVGNYVFQNFRAMLRKPGNWDCTFFYGLEWSSRLKDQPVEPYLSARRMVRRLGKAYPVYRSTLDMLFSIGRRFRKFDLYHETNYVPMPFDGPSIVTVYDLSFIRFPETHPPERVRYLERYFISRLPQVTHIITISEAMKTEISKMLSVPLERISVTPLAVNDSFTRTVPEVVEPLLRRYGLKSGGYILSVGTLEPRKNLPTLLQAYSTLSVGIRAKYPLLLVGATGWLMEKLDDQIGRLGIRENVIKAGYVPEKELPALYSGALMFVYPSLYEGFGLPPLEAMASGAPVIASDVSSIPEVVGDASIRIDPQDPDSLASAMTRLIEEPDLRRQLRNRGFERAALFSWPRCAEMTLEIYDRVARRDVESAPNRR